MKRGARLIDAVHEEFSPTGCCFIRILLLVLVRIEGFLSPCILGQINLVVNGREDKPPITAGDGNFFHAGGGGCDCGGSSVQ